MLLLRPWTPLCNSCMALRRSVACMHAMLTVPGTAAARRCAQNGCLKCEGCMLHALRLRRAKAPPPRFSAAASVAQTMRALSASSGSPATLPGKKKKEPMQPCASCTSVEGRPCLPLHGRGLTFALRDSKP